MKFSQFCLAVAVFTFHFVKIVSALPADVVDTQLANIEARAPPPWLDPDQSALDEDSESSQVENTHQATTASESPEPTPAPTPAPTSVTERPGKGSSGDMTWNIVNSMGEPVFLVYERNLNAPPPRGNPTAAPLATSTQIAFPSGWAGRITVGKGTDPMVSVNGLLSSANSLIKTI